MAAIRRIEVEIKTSNVANAGTDGDVYLGICGREFYIDRDDINDFERGRRDIYIFGGSTANTVNRGENDPQDPQLYTENLPGAAGLPDTDVSQVEEYPVYIRFEPLGGSPDWKLEAVDVRVFVGNEEVTSFFYQRGLWLGRKSGKFLYLQRPLLVRI